MFFFTKIDPKSRTPKFIKDYYNDPSTAVLNVAKRRIGSAVHKINDEIVEKYEVDLLKMPGEFNCLCFYESIYIF